jgi:hypothetical protein
VLIDQFCDPLAVAVRVALFSIDRFVLRAARIANGYSKSIQPAIQKIKTSCFADQVFDGLLYCLSTAIQSSADHVYFLADNDAYLQVRRQIQMLISRERDELIGISVTM